MATSQDTYNYNYKTGQFEKSATDLKWIEMITKLLDSTFKIPGTNIRFGIDPLLSLLPVAGDLITYFISGILIYTMHRNGASRKVVVKMALNSTLDAVIGAIPVVGTIGDIFYRSNEKNLRLLREHYSEGKHQGSGNGILFLLLAGILAIGALAIYGIYKLTEFLF